jgi:hypothetical protein
LCGARVGRLGEKFDCPFATHKILGSTHKRQAIISHVHIETCTRTQKGHSDTFTLLV